MFRHSLCALAFLSLASPAAAWTYLDYTSGASLKEVRAALATRGGSLELVSGESPGNRTEVYVVQPASIPVLTFCQGKLAGYSDRIPGSIEAFLQRVERENLKSSSAMPRFRLSKDARTGYELTEAQWFRPNGVLLSLSWSAAGSSGVGLETVTQDCHVEEPSVLIRADKPQQEPSGSAAVEPPAAPPDVVASAPEADQPPRAAAPADGESLTGTLHTPGVEMRDAAGQAAGGTEAPSRSAAEEVTPSDSAAPATGPLPSAPTDIAALPAQPPAPPEAGSASPADGGSTPPAPAQAAQTPAPASVAPSVQPDPPAQPPPATAEPAVPPAREAVAAVAPATPDFSVPMPPEAPVDLTLEPRQPLPTAPSQQVVVVVPPPPDVPSPSIEPVDPGTASSLPAVANVPLPPPRPAGLVVRRDTVPGIQRASTRPQRLDAKPAPEPELPSVIVPGSAEPDQLEPALEGGDAAPTATLSPRPPFDVGPRGTQAITRAAEPPDGQDDGQDDGDAAALVQARPQPLPEATSTVTRRGGPSTPEQCAAAFRSYDPATRTYRAHSGAVRSCP